MKLECSHQRTVASIGERSDDKAACVAEVLVAVGDVRRNHPNDDLLLLKVVAELRDPLKVVGGADTVFTQLGYNVASYGWQRGYCFKILVCTTVMYNNHDGSKGLKTPI